MKENYVMFTQIIFKAENKKEAREKTWQLESLLDENGYYLKQHHTSKAKDLRSVRYGR